MPKKKLAVERKLKVGKEATSESTCLPDQPAVEPTPASAPIQSTPEASSAVPEASTIDPLLSSGIQIKGHLQDLQGLSIDVAASESTRVPASTPPQPEPEASSTIPKASTTDSLLSSGMQLYAKAMISGNEEFIYQPAKVVTQSSSESKRPAEEEL